ncbi:hypothetical protein E1218_08620 [Kribbella turkmenica]|uniref:DUF4386 family protein n=1 Tax=Kribbella turkmenica TaxID=2530375 RepID=A0A4R4XBH1_9ACTN|nr:hypothetical protein [Kribbella turkmenica]TDD27988.1 hypothetical protein E1218_08620 [Kribbella turkmenica]
MVETGLDAPGRQWRTMSVTTGVAGLAGFVLVAVSQALVQAGGGEPAFDAPGQEILGFFETRNDTLYPIGSFLGLIAVLALLWFFAGFWVVLRSAEGMPPWRSVVALGSGLVYVVLVMRPGWDLAGFRADEGVDPQLARLAYDNGNLGFANAWLALASFLVAAGWIILSTRALPAWLGWVALAAAAGFLAGRAFWTTPIWLIPYAAYWLWTIVVSVQLLRGRLRTASAAQ